MSLIRSTSCALTLCERSSDTKESSRPSNLPSDRWAPSLAKNIRKDNIGRDGVKRGSLLSVILFVCYLPLFISGPLMTFDTFDYQFNRPLRSWTSARLSAVVFLIVRVVFWIVIFEVTSHFIYYHALFDKPSFMAHTSLWAAVGFSYLRGQFFMVKYFVIFGGAGALAMLDQLSPAAPPSCISRIYRYSTTWRSFDRGLYNFMSRHIYYAVGGSKRGPFRQLVGALLCFAFVYTWHGMHKSIFYWTMMNFIGIVVEVISDRVSHINVVQEFEREYLSRYWSVRLKSMLFVPLTAMSWFAIFVFFAGCNVGYLMFYRLLLNGFPAGTLLVFISLYCFINTCKEIERWEAKRLSEKVDVWEQDRKVDCKES